MKMIDNILIDDLDSSLTVSDKLELCPNWLWLAVNL